MSNSENQKKGHFVICGWKGDMNAVLKDILQANPRWKPEDIVVVAKISNDMVKELHSDLFLKDVQVIQMEQYTEAALIKARVKDAARILIVADWSNKSESMTETDAKTVMCAMTIEKLAPQVYMVAELLDASFDVYLKMAHVDEVIYSREYARIILANTVSTAGLAHVIHELLDVHLGSDITTVDIPQEYVGKTFGELCQHFESTSGGKIICIGLLENTGNIHVLKKKALTEAQKSPEMRTVLKNLKHVKEIESNLPKLNPGDDYEVHTNSMAVVVANFSGRPNLRIVGEREA